MIKLLLLPLAFLLVGATPDPSHHALGRLATELHDFPRWHEDLKEDGRFERMTTLARAQLAVAADFTCDDGGRKHCTPKFGGTSLQLVALLGTAAFWESRVSRRIHAGDCHKGECDGGKARSVYQFQVSPVVPQEIWDQANGLDFASTAAATEGAALALAAAWKSCHHKRGLLGLWDTYATGSCRRSFSGSLSRKHWYQRHLAKLSKQ